MQYKDMELKEANGVDYPLSNTPKRMLVWYDDVAPREREVLGFFNGSWLAVDPSCGNVAPWEYAAEIPEEPKKRWRPFKDTAELFAANGGHDILWLKSKTSGECRLVLSYGNDYVKIQCKWNMGELMREYTFKDGRPCGVEEDA